MGKECENVQVLALAEALGIQVVIAYLDGHDLVDGIVSQHSFGPSDGSKRVKLHFLYRPGHYDILYPR
jgi:ubiquitin thioesterase protein OTUB1